MKKVIIIAGPTAGGKSGFALQLAQKLNGEIINADSLQVYADLQILSARPKEAEMQGIPHHLYGFLDCHTNCNAVTWATLCTEKIHQIQTPIVVGGTGMYLKTLIDGIHDIPEIPPEIQEKVRQMPLSEVSAQLTEKLFSDAQRLRRALCVQLATGKSLSFFYNQPKKQFLEADFETYFINPPRSVLYDRCAKRFHQMLAAGAVDEVISLMKKNPTGNVLQAIGIREINAYLNNIYTKEEMIEKAIIATRQYAKRQITWFKNQLKNCRLIENV